jgi:iron complex outermembrane receptor protein
MVVSGFSQIAVARTIDYQFFEELFGEPVTLSANGMPQRVSDVAINLTVITAEEIQSSGAHSIPEVVQRLAGINVIQWGAESCDVMVRGYNQGYNPRLLVMVNGRQVYLDHYGMTAWAAIPVQMNEIRQIEVVKGPNAALFGFNAVSGAINIVTFNPLYESPSEVSVAVGTAQHTEMNVMGSLRGKEGDWGVRLSASGSASDQYTYEHGWVDLLQPGRNELFLKRDPRRQWVTLDYVAALDEGLHLRIEGSDADSQTNQMYPYGSLVDANYHVRSGKFTLMSERLHGQTEFSLYHNILDYDTVSLYSPRALLKNEVTVFKAENVGKLGVKHAYRVTGEYRFNRMNSSPVNAGKVSTRIVSLSGAWEWKMSSSVSLMNAVRYDNWHSQRAGGFGVLSYPAPSLTNEDFDREINEVSFNSSLIAQLTERDVLRLSAARGALLPSLVELSFLQVSPLPINNTINFLGNPELKPSIVE